MAVSSDSLERLADKIGYNYAEKVHDAYFQETTEKTYRKWFDKNGGKRSKLDPYKHSGDITIGPDGKAHYWALKRKYYHVRKKGKHFVPNKMEMAAAVRQAYKTMNAFSAKMSKTKTGFGIEMKMAVDPNVRMYEYKGSYKATLSDGKEEFDYKKGKVNQLDRLLLNSLREWGDGEGYEIVVESTYEGSE
jgi:hypothetical protein